LNLPLVGFWVKLLSIPRPWLYGGILVVATLGAFSVHRSSGDLVLVAIVGVIGLVLRLLDAPVAPVMIGLILGPAAEQHLRRSLAISQNDPTVFFTRPIAAGLLVAAAAVVVWAPMRTWLRARRLAASPERVPPERG
jgi:putative tricarboxylic transport membrane protein